jgi:hypothetical protein
MIAAQPFLHPTRLDTATKGVKNESSEIATAGNWSDAGYIVFGWV